MKRILSLLTLLIAITITINAQINPLSSPYYNPGPYAVIMDSVMTTSPDILIFRPSSTSGAPYPTVLFQPGANSGTAYITKHSYDLYWQHLASYGYVIIIMNNTAGGPNASLFKNMHNYIKTEVNSGTSWMSDYVDLGRFIVSGHSNGGMNATDIIIDRPSEIQAIVYLASYPNPGIFGLGAQNVSGYTGKVLLMCGDEDETSVVFVGTTNEVAEDAYDTRFTDAACKSWVFYEGVGHGGFGDYNNPAQSVGTIGREPVTASIRHSLVSFLNSQFQWDAAAWNNYSTPSLQPNSVFEFKNTCGEVTRIPTTEAGADIIVYPNPTSSILSIEWAAINEQVLVVITDMQGRTVDTDAIDGNKGLWTKDMSRLSSGLYNIVFQTSNQKETLRFQKY